MHRKGILISAERRPPAVATKRATCANVDIRDSPWPVNRVRIEEFRGSIPRSSTTFGGRHGEFVPGRDGHEVVANGRGRSDPDEPIQLPQRSGPSTMSAQRRGNVGFPACGALELGLLALLGRRTRYCRSGCRNHVPSPPGAAASTRPTGLMMPPCGERMMANRRRRDEAQAIGRCPADQAVVRRLNSPCAVRSTKTGTKSRTGRSTNS